jgi:hypothetical protein
VCVCVCVCVCHSSAFRHSVHSSSSVASQSYSLSMGADSCACHYQATRLAIRMSKRSMRLTQAGEFSAARAPATQRRATTSRTFSMGCRSRQRLGKIPDSPVATSSGE